MFEEWCRKNENRMVQKEKNKKDRDNPCHSSFFLPLGRFYSFLNFFEKVLTKLVILSFYHSSFYVIFDGIFFFTSSRISFCSVKREAKKMRREVEVLSFSIIFFHSTH